jgi:hypothetical protein
MELGPQWLDAWLEGLWLEGLWLEGLWLEGLWLEGLPNELSGHPLGLICPSWPRHSAMTIPG